MKNIALTVHPPTPSARGVIVMAHRVGDAPEDVYLTLMSAQEAEDFARDLENCAMALRDAETAIDTQDTPF